MEKFLGIHASGSQGYRTGNKQAKLKIFFQSPPDVDTLEENDVNTVEENTEKENNRKSGMGALGCIGHLGSLFFFLWISYQVGTSRMGPGGMIENPSAGWSWFVLAGIVGTIISFGINLSRK